GCSPNRDPVLVDDRLRGGARLDPLDQSLRLAGRRAARHEREGTDALVLTGLGVAQGARDALVVDRAQAASDEVERDEADRASGAEHGGLHEAVGRLALGAGRDRLLAAEEDLSEGVRGTGGGGTRDELDRAARSRARHLAPGAGAAGEDRLDLAVGEGAER